VVEAAGNGSQNFDDAVYGTPQSGFPASWGNPFGRQIPMFHSLAVGVGE
jgi:hypothetical protein